jgi:hypothetical protein
MVKTVSLTAIVSCVLTLLAVHLVGWAPPPKRVLLENPKVRVTELSYQPGAPRERSIRATDQVIVFLDDCRYQRKDPVTGQMTVREHKSGDVIWHDKAEDAPELTNLGDKTYRTVVVELK